MHLLVAIDPIPSEPAGAGVDPGQHDGIGLECVRGMLAQFAGLDHHPFFGLPLDQSKILPGGDRQQ